jgi:hypothetical protein
VLSRCLAFPFDPRGDSALEQIMSIELTPEQLETLRAYSAGRLGTRETIDRVGLHDYADLLIALARNNLDLPKPAETPTREANIARARDILLPRLRQPRDAADSRLFCAITQRDDASSVS